jgi:hypothetical protein
MVVQVSTKSRKGMFDAMSASLCADEQVAASVGVSKRGLGMSAVPVPTSVSPKEHETINRVAVHWVTGCGRDWILEAHGSALHCPRGRRCHVVGRGPRSPIDAP